MKKLLLIIVSLFPLFTFSQEPISLFEETTKWKVISRSKDGICSGGTQTDTDYRNVGDTIISGSIFKKLEVITKKFALLFLPSCPIIQYSEKIFIRNTSNMIIQYNLKESKLDTLFYITGTTLNDSAKISRGPLYNFIGSAYYKIKRIDSVTLGNKKYRKFEFIRSDSSSFYFVDGVGFASTGPIPSPYLQCEHESGFTLLCFELNQSIYTQIGNCRETPIFQPSSAMCLTILALRDGTHMGEVKTNFNNSTKILETSMEADEIHVYNLSGMEVAFISQSKVLNLNKLRPGMYLSRAHSNNRKSVYKFQIED